MKTGRRMWVTLAAALLLAGAARATTLTWDNDDGTMVFETANNWDPNQAPAVATPYDDLVFGATGAGTVTLNATGYANSITFKATAGAYDIATSGSYTLSLKSAAGVTVEDGAGTQTISAYKCQFGTNGTTFDVQGASTTLIISKFDPTSKNFVKSGAGTLRTDGGWTPGDMNINAGTWDLRYSIGNGAATAGKALNGAGRVTNGGATTPNLYVGGYTSGTGSFSGTIDGALNLQMGRTTGNDGMVQTLSGNNTYTGTTKVYTGTLYVNGTTSGQGSYSVLGRTNGSNKAMLGGMGVIGLAASASMTIHNPNTAADGGTSTADAIVYPGASDSDTGTLTVGTAGNGNQVIFGTNAIYRVDIGAAGASDKLVVRGDVDLGSATELDLLSLSGAWDGSTYTIMTYTGTRIGGKTFATVTGKDAAYSVQYDVNLGGGVKAIQLVPEPATLGVLMLGGIGALLRRRRTA